MSAPRRIAAQPRRHRCEQGPHHLGPSARDSGGARSRIFTAPIRRCFDFPGIHALDIDSVKVRLPLPTALNSWPVLDSTQDWRAPIDPASPGMIVPFSLLLNHWAWWSLSSGAAGWRLALCPFLWSPRRGPSSTSLTRKARVARPPPVCLQLQRRLRPNASSGLFSNSEVRAL
jgi:hypothetical protein